mgnify:CR=1 FL=1
MPFVETNKNIFFSDGKSNIFLATFFSTGFHVDKSKLQLIFDILTFLNNSLSEALFFSHSLIQTIFFILDFQFFFFYSRSICLDQIHLYLYCFYDILLYIFLNQYNVRHHT